MKTLKIKLTKNNLSGNTYTMEIVEENLPELQKIFVRGVEKDTFVDFDIDK